MDKINFREADELVFALQNDVEGIIFELRGEDKRENGIGVPACFSGTLYDYLNFLKRCSALGDVEVKGNRVVFYDRGNKQFCKVIDDDIDRELELEIRAEIDRVSSQIYEQVMTGEMRKIGMIR